MIAYRELEPEGIDRTVTEAKLPGPGQSERDGILTRRPWLWAIGQSLQDEYNSVEQPVPERLAALLKELASGEMRPQRLDL